MSDYKTGTPRIADSTLDIVKASGLRLKKSLGQNFLTDGHVMSKIVSAADISPEDLIIEVGPGIGSLTQELAERAGHVVAIELDSDVIPVLSENLRAYNNIEIINADILKTDVSEIIAKNLSSKGTGKAKLVANLPYYITTPIIMGLLEKRVPLDSVIVMIQKEVARRMCAKPGTKDFGSLTLAVSYYSEAYLVANVPRNCFVPRPNVDSAVIKLTLLEKPPVGVNNEGFMFEVIKSAFSMRRKTLVNCLHSAELAEMSKEDMGALLQSLGINPSIRGEELGLAEYAELTNEIEARAGSTSLSSR